MATPSKKAVAKVPAKKAVVPAAPVVKKQRVVNVSKSSVKLIEFGVIATIPTQQYGNIMPSIRVQADSIEEARAAVMPFIEELYSHYGEKPRDGARLAFLGKITETVKEVAPVAAPAPAQAPTAPQATDTPAPVAQDVPAPVATAQAPVAAPESEFAARARKMIGLAMTEEAAEKIKAQIETSEKIPAHEKPALIDLVQDKLIKFSAESAF